VYGLFFTPRRRTILAALWALTFLLGSAVAAQPTGESDAATRQYAAAVALQNREIYDLAAEEWEKFISDFSSDSRVAKAQHYLGVCHLKSQKYEEAIRAFDGVLRKHPSFELAETTHLFQGIAQYNLARNSSRPNLFANADATFALLLKKFPEGKHAPQALYYRGECAYHLGQREEAVSFYSDLVKRFPESELTSDALYALGVAQEELGRFPAAGATYARFLKEFPKSPLVTEVSMRRGESLFQSGDFAGAEKLFAAAAQDDFALADHAAMRQAASILEQKQYARAATAYSSISTRFPNSIFVVPANLAAGKCAYLAGKYDAAREGLGKVLAGGGPEAAEAAHWIARSYLKQQNPSQALKTVESVLSRAAQGEFAAALELDRADSLFELPGRRGEAVARYAELAERYPRDPAAAEALYMAAFAASSEQQHRAAVEYADGFLRRFSGNRLEPDVLHVAAESHLQLNNYGEAESLYRRLLKDFPEFPQAETCLVRIGLALSLNGEHAKAVAHLNSVLPRLKSPETVAEANYLLGTSLVATGKAQLAAEALERSLAAAQQWRKADEALLALAGAYRESKQLPRARAAIERLLREHPNSRLLDTAQYRLAEMWFAESDFHRAAEGYQQLLDRWPDSALAPHALYGLGWSQLSAGDHASAERSLSKLIAEHPRHELTARAHYGRAVARQQSKEFAGAVADIEAFLASKPSAGELADAQYVLGICQAGLNRPSDAVATFRALLADSPDYAGADKVRYELAWALKAQRQEAEAAAEFKQLAERHESSPLAAEALYHAGEFQYSQQEYPAAAASYYAAMSKAGRNELGEKALHKLGWAYFRQDQFDKADKTFAAQRQMYPNSVLASDAAFVQAECLFKQSKFAAALPAYEQVRETSNPEFQALALLHAGQAAGQLQQWDRSLALLERCTREFPDSAYVPEALYEKAVAKQNQGRLDDALSLYEAVTAKSNAEVAARARFMIGEIYFERKDHKEALRQFFKVASGYSYPQWQAAAHFEAGRCFEVLGKVGQAKQSYQEVVEKFPESDKVALARSRLAALNKGQ